MAVPVRSKSFHDPMADSRRRRAWLWRVSIMLALVGFLCAGFWIFYWSPVFAVTDIRVSGASSIGNDNIADAVYDLLGQKNLYVFRPHHSIIFIDGRTVADYIFDKYPSIAEADVRKDYPHALIIMVKERHAIGQWCRLSGDESGDSECQLFDAAGMSWGSSLPSFGPLLMLVEDERKDGEFDSDISIGILAAIDGLPELGLMARKVILPDAEPGGIRVVTDAGYELLFDSLSDVPDQLSVLAVFLSDRAKDPTFSPAYIDLRTPGRVYYK